MRPPVPEPSAVQLLPSHLAMLVAAMPPAIVNPPPPYRSLPDTARANTIPFTTEPSGHRRRQHHPTAPVPLGDAIGIAPARRRPCIQIAAGHRQSLHSISAAPKYGTHWRPAAPVPLGNLSARDAVNREEPAPRVHVAA